MTFPFNQPPKTNDCGYRCLYYTLNLKESYNSWLENFKFFSPEKKGIFFNEICTLLDFYKKKYRFTQVTEKGLYIIYSGIWLHHEGRKHGHYFVYHDGVVYCSTHSEPYRLKLSEVIKRLESQDTNHGFYCLEVDK